MTILIKPHRFTGIVSIPASKSHTIRRLFIASLAVPHDGVSEIEQALDSLDTRSCVSVCRALGAEIIEHRSPESEGENPLAKLLRLTVRGAGKENAGNQACPAGETNSFDVEPVRCDVGNSGTTLFLGLAAAALGSQNVEFDGDDQIRSRSAGPLLDALAGLGVNIKSAPDGRAPITVCGPWKGGRVSLPCPTSQYLSALLLASPLAPAGVVTEIDVPLLYERPYIEMTLSYLDSQGIPYKAASDFSYFNIPGGSMWKPMSGPVPADFSSAAFPAAAAAISGGSVTLLGLDPDDTQGDKAFFGFLKKMGCEVKWELVPSKQVPIGESIPEELHALGVQSAQLCMGEWQLTVSGRGRLKGGEFDLGDTPDLLPALAAVACFAEGDTALVNVANARIKETDRISVMAEELLKLGFKTTERSNGLIIHGTGGISNSVPLLFPGSASNSSTERTFKTDSRKDHRVAMALACAALGCQAPVEIAGAESAEVTYPGFLEMLTDGDDL